MNRTEFENQVTRAVGFKNLGKRKMGRIFAEHCSGFNSCNAIYQKSNGWERLSYRGYYLEHQICCGQDMIYYHMSDGSVKVVKK